MDGVRDCELAIGLGLKGNKVGLAMVYSARDVTVLPPGVVHIGKVLELLANGLVGPALLWESVELCAISWDHLGLELGQTLLDLLADRGADTWGAEEVAIEDAAGVMVEFGEGPEEPAALELPPGAAEYAENEEEEDDIFKAADEVAVSISIGDLD